MEKPDLIDRLVDFDNYGLTATDRCSMRMEAWEEITRLRWRVEQLEELNRFRVYHELKAF